MKTWHQYARANSPVIARNVMETPKPGGLTPQLPVFRPAWVVLCLMMLLPIPAWADLTVPVGSTIDLASGAMDLACTDVVVGGTLKLSSGQLGNVRHLTIQPGGTLDAGSGNITLGGNWTNNGAFVAGASLITLNDICAVNPSAVSGSTSFYRVSFFSNAGKTWQFQAGYTQAILQLLTIHGAAGIPLQFRSTTPSSAAFINLIAPGTQDIANVGVVDNYAIGVWLAPFQSNLGGGGNVQRWFGVPDANSLLLPTPTLNSLALFLLLLLTTAAGALTLVRKLSIAKIEDSNHEDV